jgi:hypothetical protein
MSDESLESRRDAERAVAYEPPKVTPLGNVRDLLAGAIGTGVDADMTDPDLPNRVP